MDMTEFLQRHLTNEVLLTREDARYEGRIARVERDRVFNKFKFTKEPAPVIHFEDGWCWIPNIGARRTLTAAWGSETDDWIGRRMAVYLRVVLRTEQGSGRAVEKPEKQAEPLSDDFGEIQEFTQESSNGTN